MKVFIIAATVSYNMVMVFCAGLYTAAIFDPVQFLWLATFFFLGPLILVIGFTHLVRYAKGIPHFPVLLCLAGILSVLVWSICNREIGAWIRPKVFSLVAGDNQKLAESAIHAHPAERRFILSGFRYPFFKLGQTQAYHQNEVLFVFIPDRPGRHDLIIYDPKGTHSESHLEHLVGPWFYQSASN